MASSDSDSGQPSRSADSGPPVYGFITARAIITADELGVLEALRDGPLAPAKIAARTDTHLPTLVRWLRALAATEVIEALDDGSFALGPLGLRRRLSPIEGIESYRMWDAAAHTLRTGEPAFPHVFGREFYRYLDENPEADERWAAWSDETVVSQLEPTVDACRLTGTEILVDVGGGRGVFLAVLLRALPGLRGVLYEAPQVVAAAAPELSAGERAERARIVEGDFFHEVPAGGDVYLLARVIHNWSDEDAVTILRNCRRAMPAGGRLLVIETVMPAAGHPRRRNAAMGDLQSLLLLGAAIRTIDEHGALLTQAGLRLTEARPVGDGLWQVIEAAPA
jgi:hypothetical protein